MPFFIFGVLGIVAIVGIICGTIYEIYELKHDKKQTECMFHCDVCGKEASNVSLDTDEFIVKCMKCFKEDK